MSDIVHSSWYLDRSLKTPTVVSTEFGERSNMRPKMFSEIEMRPFVHSSPGEEILAFVQVSPIFISQG